jgi:hypothetical protein
MFAPDRKELADKSLSSERREAEARILQYSYELSDDGKFALVEFVATGMEALRPVLESKAEGVKAFRKGRVGKAVIEREFKKHKSEFAIDSFLSAEARSWQ